MKIKALLLLNTITLLIMLYANYGYGTGKFSNVSVADISYKFDSLFAPAGYAFIIWSIIFVFAIGFVVYQWILVKQNNTKYIKATGIWFSISNVLNTFWLYCWVNERLGLSVVIILLLLICLCILTVRLRLEFDDEPVRNIFLIWWPIAIYLGWIMVATIACIAAWLVSINWNGGILSPENWTIFMMGIAGLIYVYLLKTRNLRETAGVGIWAFVAIATRQWNSHFNISIAAMLISLVLFVFISFHAYKNRAYNIGAKLKRNEW